jgi:hypothetical protein
MKNKDDYHIFSASFCRLAGQAGLAPDEYKYEFFHKIVPKFRIHIQRKYINDQISFDTLERRIRTIAVILKSIDQIYDRQKKRNEKPDPKDKGKKISKKGSPERRCRRRDALKRIRSPEVEKDSKASGDIRSCYNCEKVDYILRTCPESRKSTDSYL